MQANYVYFFVSITSCTSQIHRLNLNKIVPEIMPKEFNVDKYDIPVIESLIL